MYLVEAVSRQKPQIPAQKKVSFELGRRPARELEESIVADKLAIESVSNVKIASKPSLPTQPILPDKLLNLALALIGGIIGALAMAFFLDYLDHGLKTPEDVEFYTNAAPLASFFNEPGQSLNPKQAERQLHGEGCGRE